MKHANIDIDAPRENQLRPNLVKPINAMSKFRRYLHTELYKKCCNVTIQTCTRILYDVDSYFAFNYISSNASTSAKRYRKGNRYLHLLLQVGLHLHLAINRLITLCLCTVWQLNPHTYDAIVILSPKNGFLVINPVWGSSDFRPF